MNVTHLIGNFKKIIHISLKFVIDCFRTRTNNFVIYFQNLFRKNNLNIEQVLPVDFKTFWM